MLLFPFQLTVQYLVMPCRKNLGLPGMPLPASDSAHPLGDEVLKHLEEWGYRDQGDDFGEVTLRAEVLEHFEEWDCDQGGVLGDLTNSEGRTERPRMSLPPPSDRAHPLWDRELDG
jgi:hypothetical protein